MALDSRGSGAQDRANGDAEKSRKLEDADDGDEARERCTAKLRNL